MHTFVMCVHFLDVRILHLMLHCCCIVDNWLFPIHMSTNHCSTKGAQLIDTTYHIITEVRTSREAVADTDTFA